MGSADASTAVKKTITKKSRDGSNGDTVLPRAPFSRICKAVVKKLRSDHNPPNFCPRFTKQAISTLQEETERHLVGMFRKANVGRTFSKRKTLHSKDFSFAKLMRDEPGAPSSAGEVAVAH